MTDADFLAAVLSDRRPWTLNEILQRSFSERGCGLTVHSRAADLRKRGYVIVHETHGKRGDGSIYRLVSGPVVAADDPSQTTPLRGPDWPGEPPGDAPPAQLDLLDNQLELAEAV